MGDSESLNAFPNLALRPQAVSRPVLSNTKRGCCLFVDPPLTDCMHAAGLGCLRDRQQSIMQVRSGTLTRRSTVADAGEGHLAAFQCLWTVPADWNCKSS